MDFVKGLDDAMVESASRKAFAALPDLSCNSPLLRAVRESWANGPPLFVQLIFIPTRASFLLSPYPFLPQPNPSPLLGVMGEPP